MSETPTDPSGAAGGAEQPSEEEVRAYLAQLRDAPVEQVLAEVSSALLNAAQVKLGRSDARLLIDLTATIAEGARGALSEEVSKQIDDALTQLRLSQVEAEKQVRASSEEESNDISEAAADTGSSTGESPRSGGAAGSEPGRSSGGASGLWVPGR
ncbi:MAG: hypothetical protein ACLFRD_02755 [Nitriliruptoraceae bacterium]